MITYKNFTIIGTSHIAIESVKQVSFLIKTTKPDIIALELDKKRFLALIAKKRKLTLRDLKELGLKGFLFNLFGAWVEKKLGKAVGTTPGAEMKKAIVLAKKTKAQIALIDQDINLTIKKLLKEITWKEKFRFVGEIIKNIFISEKIAFDLRKVPSEKIINKLIKRVKKSYPSFYKVLILERNKILAKNLYTLIKKYPNKKILAIVGAGHEKFVMNNLKSKLKK